MSEKNTVTIDVFGLEGAARGIDRTTVLLPGAVARGLNAAIEKTRMRLVEEAKDRYAVNEAGARHLDDMRQNERATSARLAASMRIRKMRNDLGYFESRPSVPLPGLAWRRAPEDGYMGHVLKSTPMKHLTGGSTKLGQASKGFLARFNSGHVGMVQRLIGVPSTQKTTARGHKRWKSKSGVVEKLVTVGSPSAAAMINTVWPGRDVESAEFFMEKLAEAMKGAIDR